MTCLQEVLLSVVKERADFTKLLNNKNNYFFKAQVLCNQRFPKCEHCQQICRWIGKASLISIVYQTLFRVALDSRTEAVRTNDAVDS